MPGGKNWRAFSGQTQLATGHVWGADFENRGRLKYEWESLSCTAV